jgi:hypothetical protein
MKMASVPRITGSWMKEQVVYPRNLFPHRVLLMLRGTVFVLQLMILLLCQNLRHQNVLEQVQKYVVKYRQQKSHLLVQMGMEMVTEMVMVMEMETTTATGMMDQMVEETAMKMVKISHLCH